MNNSPICCLLCLSTQEHVEHSATTTKALNRRREVVIGLDDAFDDCNVQAVKERAK
jgi:hypothetical protein